MDAQLEPVYDALLQEQLEEYAVPTIRLEGQCVVRECGEAARYNTALWFAMKYGLPYSYDVEAGTFTLTMPD